MQINRTGFNLKGNYTFDINPYYACYVRTSPWMEFKCMEMLNDQPWELNVINPDHDNFVNLYENFCFKIVSGESEKVYMLNFDHEFDKTKFWHYNVPAVERDNENYEPNLFEKEMPLMNVRPHFKDKNKFIKRMDGWVIIS